MLGRTANWPSLRICHGLAVFFVKVATELADNGTTELFGSGIVDIDATLNKFTK